MQVDYGDDDFSFTPQDLYHMELIEGYHQLRTFSNAIFDSLGGVMFTVAECVRSFFTSLSVAEEPKILQQLNPFPEFDSVQFYDVDPNDPKHTHYYLVPNPDNNNELEEARGSGTGFIHSFFEHFDEGAHSKRIALDILHNARRGIDEYTIMADEIVKNKRNDKPFSTFEKGSLRDSLLMQTIKNYERAIKENTFQKDEKQYQSDDFKNYLELRDAVLAKWEWGSASGTALHRAIELFLDRPKEVDSLNLVYQTIEFRYFLDFFRDLFVNGKMRVVRSELRICDWKNNRVGTYAAFRAAQPDCPSILREILCAAYLTGSADLIFREEGMAANEIGIGDWKRSKEIYQKAFGNKFGTGPCAEVPDCNLYHYYLQLNLYAYLIELNTHYRVVKMFIAIFHPNNPTYLIFHVPDMRTTIHLMLVERIKYNYSNVFTSDSVSDKRKREKMLEFLSAKKVNKSNIKEFLGGEAYQKKRKVDDEIEVILV